MLTAGLQTRPQAAALQRRPAPRMAPRRGPVPRPVCQAPPAAASAPAQTQELSVMEPPAQQMGLPIYTKAVAGTTDKTRVVVLGTGWGAMSMIKSWQESLSDKYELILVSPRNYFVYTPLLPAMCAGTVEERSIVEAVRAVLGSKGKFFEAKVCDVFPEERSIVACFPEDAGFAEACFKITYDKLVVAVGCANNTFGIKGVQENACFFKNVEDAAALRLRVSECFERAALPQTTPEERKQLLSFVICGGGPTGVEVAAELHDLIKEDLVKLYPNEIKDVQIFLVEMSNRVLGMYDEEISKYTKDLFTQNGINLLLESKVCAVNPESVTIQDKEGNSRELPFGACVWATGVAMNPLLKTLQEKLPAGSQTHFRGLVVDEFLRVKGSNGSIFALGDAAVIEKEGEQRPEGRPAMGLPPTAQVARQEGQYLAGLLADHALQPDGDLPEGAKKFVYSHKGSAAYVGADHAVLDIPNFGLFLGTTAGLIWKGFETFSQISFRNQVLVATDWARAKIFGRDTSRV